MKIVAFYLPQYHEIKENNKWWGDGFTDWTNVKKSKPLFDGHYQPREPLNDNYYDLSKVANIKWQSELAEKYGIYGFCYYHYWFKGKLLLEKPMEKMLEDKDIKLPFCISWANEPWTRSWDGKHKDVLIDQIYGDEGDWEDHISYLLQFFKDDRYIKVDNKPIFLITKYREIKRCKEMFDYFNNRAKEHSLDGIYFVHTDRGYYKIDENINFSAKVEFEPTFTSLTTNITSLWTRRVFRYIVKIINILFNTRFLVNIPISTGNLYKRSLENKPKGNIKTIPGAFISWDNSPRRRHEASILQDFSIEDFKDYISKKILKSRDIYNSDFLFINAWNEWAEGAYLEPDKKYGFSYLEAVQSSLRKLKMR